MGRIHALIVSAFALAAATGCMTGKPLQVDSLNRTLKEALPASTVTPSAAPKTPPATQFAAAWQTKLGQLPDPTKNGVMNSGIVGQVFLYTDKFAPADIVGTLTVIASDATDRANGQPAKQSNVWHFDVETLKRMVVNDDRFGKSIALFLPWPEEWTDVNRLYVQARYDQPNSYTVYAPPATVTLDFFTTAQHQTSHSAARVPASQIAIPDPKLLLQNAKGGPAPSTPVPPVPPVPPATALSPQQAGYAAAWPTVSPGQPIAPPPGAPAIESKDFPRTVIPRK
jgi:hypothetical protein